MPKKGRETELILKELESLSLGNQAVIKSPDYIIDRVTGRKREVDISIRFSIGTHEFLTIIECRNRKKVDDVTWIEQIIIKSKNLKANKIIMVSTSGFTENAKKLAKHENITLRTLEELTAEETIDWFNFLYRKQNWELIHMNITPGFFPYQKRLKKKEIKTQKYNLEDKIIKSPSGEYVNFKDVINSIINENNKVLFGDIIDNNPPIEKELNVKFDSKIKYLIEIEGITCYIDKMNIKCKYWVEAKKIPLKKLLKYKENNTDLLDQLYFEFIDNGKKISGTMAKDHKTGKGVFQGNIEDYPEKN